MSRVMLRGRNRGVIDLLVTNHLSSLPPSTTSSHLSCWEWRRKSRKCHSSRKKKCYKSQCEPIGSSHINTFYWTMPKLLTGL